MASGNITIPQFVGALPRARIDALLEEGLKRPLVLVTAGPGYGKTVAVAGYVTRRRVRTVWMRLTYLDNVPYRFWETFVAAMAAINEDLAYRLKALGFPASIGEFDAFVRLVARELQGPGHVVVVVDDCHNIFSQRLNDFLGTFVDVHLEGISLILIGRSHMGLNVPTLMNNGLLAEIRQDDLAFTHAETGELFRSRGISCDDAHIGAIAKRVEGWSFALGLLAARGREKQLSTRDMESLSVPEAVRLFEDECFAVYSARQRDMLVRLSLLRNVPLGLSDRWSEMQGEDMTAVLSGHPFVRFDMDVCIFTFHNMFRGFLQYKADLMTEEETGKVYSRAADWMLEHGHLADAMTYYRRCGRYNEMFQAIRRLPHTRMGRELTELALACLEDLPEEFVKKNPIVIFTRGAMLLNNSRIEEAHRVITDLRTEFEQGEQTPQAQAFLGEIYILLADISRVRNTDEFAWLYRRAAQYLPNGCVTRDAGLTLVDNQDTFYVMEEKPGELERMMRLFQEAMPIGAKVMKGCGRGMECLFAAESYYLTYDLPRAKEEAYRAIYRAAESGQHDIVLNAMFILLKVAVLSGSYGEAADRLSDMREHIQRWNTASLTIVADCAQAWMNDRLSDNESLPWFIDGDEAIARQPPVSVGREYIRRANWMLLRKNYYELPAFLEKTENLAKAHGFWTIRLEARILGAICFMRLDEPNKAVAALHAAYQMAWQNGIVTPFIECAGNMRTLMENVRRQEEYSFDPAWMDGVHQKASTFAKRLSTMSAEHVKVAVPGAPAQGATLSEREDQVLRCLAQGLSRDDIARHLGISINTVKTIIKNLYGKLGAVNRADAVHIAMTKGYLA